MPPTPASGYLRLFRGIVADVRIWIYARDALEISAQMTCSIDGTEPGLLADSSLNAGVPGAAAAPAE